MCRIRNVCPLSAALYMVNKQTYTSVFLARTNLESFFPRYFV